MHPGERNPFAADFEDVESAANRYSIPDVVSSLLEFLRTRGKTPSNEPPQWDEFETLAAEYELLEM